MRNASSPSTHSATSSDESRKEIKKSSYYVWFLGAQEAKGLRGLQYITPVVRSLVEREQEEEPFKVTLQVSHKGLKIVRNVPGALPIPLETRTPGKMSSGGGGGKAEMKYFIPHHLVTCVHQKDDIVACILLLYDRETKCPLHVHAYRCDSVGTATILHGQLRVLVERPENQKQLAEMESKLNAKGIPQSAVKRRVTPNGSESRSTRESESSGSSSVGRQEKIAHLYDSLAVELKERLGTGAFSPLANAPILLPPRDYDTVHRQKGNLSEINARRCLNTNVVGVNATPNGVEGATALKPPALAKGKIGSSGGSSGIGSDHAPSPDHEHDTRFMDNRSSSDEEWNADPYKESALMVQRGGGGSGGGGGGWRNSSGELSLPRARRFNSSGSASTSPARRSRINNAEVVSGFRRSGEYPSQEEQPIHPDLSREKKQQSVDPPFQSGSDANQTVGQWRRKNAEDRQRSPSPTHAKSAVGSLTPRDRFNDAKEKFLSLEKEKQEERERQEQALSNERRRNNQPIEPPISPAVMPIARTRLTKSWSRGRDSVEDEDELSQQGYSAHDDSFGQPRFNDERDFHQNLRREPSYLKSRSHGSIPDSDDFPVRVHGKMDVPYVRREEQRRKFDPSPSRRNLDSHSYSSMPPEDTRQGPPPAQIRYASPRRDRSPDVRPRTDTCKSPAKDNSRRSSRKLPVLDQNQLEELKKRFGGKIPRSHLNLNPVPFAESNSEIPLERYRDERQTRMNTPPRPAPRHQQRYPTPISDEEDERRDYRAMMHQENRNFSSRSQFESDMKRRSIYESMEDERRRNSHELAKEFKRRSFQEHGPSMDPKGLGYQELDERERYPGLDRETARLHPPDESGVPKTSPRYRHSYAEPFHHHQYNQSAQPPHEMLHRTNSSLSSGRVGIAAVHPY